MLKKTVARTKKFVQDHPVAIASTAVIIGAIAIEAKYPGTFEVPEPEIPTLKIIHVHVTE